MTDSKIKEEIQKIIDWIAIEKFRKKVLKKRPWLRKLDVDFDPHYWENLKNQLTEPLAKDLVDVAKSLGDQVVEYDERIDQILGLLGYNEETPDFEGVVEDASKPDEKTYWTKLAKKYAYSARDDDTWRNLEDLINIVVNVKKHLGLSDNELDNLTTIADLAMPTKKVGGTNTNLTLKEMISIGNSLLPYLADGRNLNELVNEINRYQKLNNELHDIKNKLDSQKDYEEIKNKNEKLESQKTEIISELGLPKNSTNQQILDKIKELMGRPSISEHKTIKTERDNLKTEIEAKKRKIAELENNTGNNVITKKALAEATASILKEWGIKISNEQKEKIQNATSAQAVEEMRNEIIKNKITELKNENNSSFYLNVVLGILALSALLILVWMAIRKTNLLKVKSAQKRLKK